MTTTSTPVAVDVNPFVGPRALRSGEALYGRDREVRRLTNLLVAERIVLLYSPSGAGKTSLIEAGLAPALRRRKFQVSPLIRVSQLTADNCDDQNRYLLSTLQALEAGLRPDDQRPPRELLEMGLERYLNEWAVLDDHGPGNELLIFDQFEEILILDPGDDEIKREFFRELGRVLAERDRWALFSMREDYIAGLDPYLEDLPTRLHTRMRLDLLSPKAALRAVEMPAATAGRPFATPAAEKLVHNLRMVQAQRGGEIVSVPGPFVEPLQLQVVCRRLWEALPEDIEEITEADVERFARVQAALGEYYAEEVRDVAETSGVRERTIREWFGQELVTDQGIRRQQQHGPGRDAEAAERAVRLLEDTHLIRAEDRRGTRWLELAHDQLVGPVQANNAEWGRTHLSTVQQQARQWAANQRSPELLMTGPLLIAGRRWAALNPAEVTALEADYLKASDMAEADRRRLRLRTVLLRCLTVVLLLSLVFAALGWRAATAEGEISASRADAARAVQFVATDPMRAMAIAEQALRRSPTDEAKDALRQAMSQNLPTAVLNHEDNVNSAVFSQRGDRLITSSWDQEVRIWDSTTGAQLHRRRYDSNVKDAEFSPDGRSVLALTDKNVLTVSSPDNPDVDDLRITGVIAPVKFSNNGSLLAVTDAVTSEVRLYDMQSRAQIRPALTGNTQPINSIAFSTNDRLIATAGQDGVARVWDTASRQRIAMLPGHAGAVFQVAFRPDDGAIATGDEHGTVRIWKWTAQGPANPPLVIEKAQQHGAANIAFDRAGDLLAYGDKSPRLFNGTTGVSLRQFDGNRNWVESAQFSADGQQAVTASDDGTTRVWDVKSGRELAQLHSPGGGLRQATLTNAGDAVATISGHAVGLFRLNDQVLRTDNADWALNATFLPGDTAVAAGGQDGRVTVWSTADSTIVARLESANVPIWDVDVDKSGRYIAAAATDGTIWVWDWRLGTVVAHRKVMPSAADVRFDPTTGETLAVAGDTVDIWRWQTNDQPRVLSTKPSNSAIFSPDGQSLAIINRYSVELWSLWGTAPEATAVGHTSDVESVAFSLDGRMLASASLDGTARIWRTDNAQSILTLEGHRGAVESVAFNDKGDQVVTGGADGNVGVWDPVSGRQLAMLPRHSDLVNKVQFSSGDHPRILSASDDTTVRIYDCDTCGSFDELNQRATRLLATDEAAAPHPAVGTCYERFFFQDPKQVSCTNPHLDEVFAVLTYSAPDDASLPPNLGQWAYTQCTGARYKNYRGKANTDDFDYYPQWSVPGPADWDLGQRTLVCVISPIDGMNHAQSARVAR